jgi:FKBP-type peptidyl-prolyl cis-trans isomerase FkpA
MRMKTSLLRSFCIAALGTASIVATFTGCAERKQSSSFNSIPETPLSKSDQFLSENKTKEGVKTTASGLQYKITKEGAGKTPKATDKVTVHYEGRLIDGTVFDSSIQRGEPATFPLNGVIRGWTEGFQLFNEGTKATLYIPSDLGYGASGSPPKIGPNQTLIFDIELIKVGE